MGVITIVLGILSIVVALIGICTAKCQKAIITIPFILLSFVLGFTILIMGLVLAGAGKSIKESACNSAAQIQI